MQLDTSKLELPSVLNHRMADKIVRELNEIFKTDPEAIKDLFAHRVPVNEALADHPTVQVTDSSPPTMSILGLLNGVTGVIPGTKVGYICGIYDDEDHSKLLGFKMHPDSKV